MAYQKASHFFIPQRIINGSSMTLAENLSDFANPTGLYKINRQNHG